MTWCGIEGHDAVADRFRRVVQAEKLASSFLFVGPPGVGKRLFAIRLAQAFLCHRSPVERWAPCLECASCQQVLATTHPDFDYVKREEKSSSLSINQFVGDRERRGKEGLCYRISLRPSSGRRRVAVIDDADYLNEASANCLLKTLEEPPRGAIIVLLGTTEQRQLPTIRSRCQVVRFRRLADATLKRILGDHELIEPELMRDESLLNHVIELAEGSLDKAQELADPELMTFITQLNRDWTGRNNDSVEIAGRVRKFVEKAGTEAPPRRARLRQIIELRMRTLRRSLIRSIEAEEANDSRHQRLAEKIAAQLDRCLAAIQELDRNAHIATLIECWVDDLCWQ